MPAWEEETRFPRCPAHWLPFRSALPASAEIYESSWLIYERHGHQERSVKRESRPRLPLAQAGWWEAMFCRRWRREEEGEKVWEEEEGENLWTYSQATSLRKRNWPPIASVCFEVQRLIGSYCTAGRSNALLRWVELGCARRLAAGIGQCGPKSEGPSRWTESQALGFLSAPSVLKSGIYSLLLLPEWTCPQWLQVQLSVAEKEEKKFSNHHLETIALLSHCGETCLRATSERSEKCFVIERF